MRLSCTVFELLLLISQNLKMSRDRDHAYVSLWFMKTFSLCRCCKCYARSTDSTDRAALAMDLSAARQLINCAAQSTNHTALSVDLSAEQKMIGGSALCKSNRHLCNGACLSDQYGLCWKITFYDWPQRWSVVHWADRSDSAYRTPCDSKVQTLCLHFKRNVKVWREFGAIGGSCKSIDNAWVLDPLMSLR